MRCPACQAHNPDSAEWCTQCYGSLRAPEPAPPAAAPATTPATASPADPPATASPATGPGPAEDTSPASGDPSAVGYVSEDGRFRRTEEGLDWRCHVCDAWNPIERTTCSTCSAPFAAETTSGPEPGELVDESVALLAAALLPGLGHILMKRTGVGIARALLYVTWLVGGLLLLFSAARAGQSALPSAPLLLGAVALWAATLLDTITLHRGTGQELLQPRVLLWLTVGVMGATMLAFAAATFTVTSAA